MIINKKAFSLSLILCAALAGVMGQAKADVLVAAKDVLGAVKGVVDSETRILFDLCPHVVKSIYNCPTPKMFMSGMCYIGSECAFLASVYYAVKGSYAICEDIVNMPRNIVTNVGLQFQIANIQQDKRFSQEERDARLEELQDKVPSRNYTHWLYAPAAIAAAYTLYSKRVDLFWGFLRTHLYEVIAYNAPNSLPMGLFVK